MRVSNTNQSIWSKVEVRGEREILEAAAETPWRPLNLDSCFKRAGLLGESEFSIVAPGVEELGTFESY